MNLIKAQFYNTILLAALAATVLTGCATNSANAQSGTVIPPSLVTPDKVESRIGTLEYKDGVPTVETAERVRDTLDFTRALNAYNNSFRGASAYAMGKGFQSIGAEDNSILIFSDVDGQQVAVPHRQHRYGLLHGDHQPVERPDGARTTAQRAGHAQRHVVFVDHRHRASRPRPRQGRQVLDRAAGLRWTAAGRRLFYRPLENQPRAVCGPRLPRKRGSEACR